MTEKDNTYLLLGINVIRAKEKLNLQLDILSFLKASRIVGTNRTTYHMLLERCLQFIDKENTFNHD